MYLLWSARNQGWLTHYATYSTDRAEASSFDREEALALCRKHKENSYVLLPVAVADMEAI